MHSFTKLWIHAMWSTKNRQQLISPKMEAVLHEFMRKQFRDLKCSPVLINGTFDHVHCLFNLNREKSLADVIKQVKGGSSHFINSSSLCDVKFAWQTGYAAFSVSDPGHNSVADYIKNQKLVHAEKTFCAEYNHFLQLHGFTPVDFTTP